MLTPENDHEKSALRLIAPDDEIKAVTKWGNFMDEEKTFGYKVEKCQGGYYRGYLSDESLIFLVTPKKEKNQ
jgi:hypothetical protein